MTSPHPSESRPDEAAFSSARSQKNLQKSSQESRLLRKKIPLIDHDQKPLDAPVPASSESLQRLDPFLQRILSRIPSDVAATFSERQLQALHQAIAQSSTHSVDMRRTLSPFCWRYYVVFLMGSERRSDARLRLSRRPWSAVTTGLLTLLLLLMGLGAYQLIYRRMLNAPTPRSVVKSVRDFYPTALPWIEKPEDCKGDEREWKDGMCYDSEHSPEF